MRRCCGSRPRVRHRSQAQKATRRSSSAGALLSSRRPHPSLPTASTRSNWQHPEPPAGRMSESARMPEPTTANAANKPAIAGGIKAKTKPYRKEKRYGEEELNQLREALDQGTLFYAQGKKVTAMEQAFAHAVDAGHAVACSSGTAAIHAALMAAGVSSGDEVIVPPITDVGTIVPVMWQGAVPVFCDLHPRTYNMTPQTV